jgi:hypothetical protein
MTRVLWLMGPSLSGVLIRPSLLRQDEEGCSFARRSFLMSPVNYDSRFDDLGVYIFDLIPPPPPLIYIVINIEIS